jgi:hypothetical protein
MIPLCWEPIEETPDFEISAYFVWFLVEWLIFPVHYHFAIAAQDKGNGGPRVIVINPLWIAMMYPMQHQAKPKEFQEIVTVQASAFAYFQSTSP